MSKLTCQIAKIFEQSYDLIVFEPKYSNYFFLKRMIIRGTFIFFINPFAGTSSFP
jgi:hypothetical protein